MERWMDGWMDDRWMRVNRLHSGSWFASACSPDHFKEICPAGHGYTYSHSDVQYSVRHLGEDDVQSTGLSWEEQSYIYPHPPSSNPSLLLPLEPQQPSYPQTPQLPQYPEYVETPQVPQRPLTPQQPSHPSQTEGEPRKENAVVSNVCCWATLSVICASALNLQLCIFLLKTKIRIVNNAEQLSRRAGSRGIASRTSTGCFDHREIKSPSNFEHRVMTPACQKGKPFRSSNQFLSCIRIARIFCKYISLL